MDRNTVLAKIDELSLIYENGVLSHPYWYIPPNKRHLIEIHDKLFQGKAELRLTLNEVAALLLVNNLIELD
ncbi:hypothetical protein [Methanosarcina mazei]|jgi:hypothetical protein|uniref:Uncharacterized protein n=1 Tax=Methanosarcina mazei TaxID=2209 RepID=A0A0F8BQ32_METMZ|nr:hypothetical protein [Methanosarcina mazei]KKF99656.1 hypothetical protein DU47_11590 [Methanosarcina mazei]KKG02203.1 hypothetical protein DU40_06755 [Methanosarcina mazei]KKG04616.1 hypothetical protein DU31_04030 [Methanosarcina mazei]KKG12673.1 hypothetical protein DU34_20310 [Methanosarcina mazei]KKG28612.1 hypothetical protein DU49_07705 [Methanosarcina mazei]